MPELTTEPDSTGGENKKKTKKKNISRMNRAIIFLVYNVANENQT
jgi:hypothetical protein